MSTENRVSRLARHTRLFRTAQLEGAYDPLSQTATVLNTDREALGRFASYYDARDFLTTAHHELAHWLDHTSTLWGQSLLVDIHNAFAAWQRKAPEEFWRIVKVDHAMNRGTNARYFEKTDQPDADIGSAQTWQTRISCGLTFGPDGQLDESRPAVFVSFYDLSGARISRVPLGLPALLEANAMSAELVTRAQIIETVPPEAQGVERAVAEAAGMRALYDPRLTRYSAAAHLLALRQETGDAFLAFQLTGALATLILNLPPTMAADLRAPAEHRERWNAHVDALIERADPGYLFLVLCEAAPRFENTGGSDVAAWVAAAAATAGLPSLEEIRAGAEDRMRALEREVLDGGEWPLKRAIELLQIGRQNFAHRGVIAPPVLTLGAAHPDFPYRLPPVVLLDEELAPVTQSVIEEGLLDPRWSLSMVSAYNDFAYPVIEACRS